MLGRRGQTIVEYTIIVIIILGVMIAMKDYVKRGIQGRWKTATDDFGGQYDPEHLNSDINYSTQVNAVSIIQISNGTYDSQGTTENGQWTNRVDITNSLETKAGYTQVGN
jgi:Flp pilus assembly pilin Flp